jgi:hypothetical protein
MPARIPHSLPRVARRLIALGALVATLGVAGAATAAPARSSSKSCSVWLPIVGTIQVEHGTTITPTGGALIVCNNGTWTIVFGGGPRE